MKAVIFDLDGVICFTDKLHYKAWKNVADEQGIYFDEKIKSRFYLFNSFFYSTLISTSREVYYFFFTFIAYI